MIRLFLLARRALKMYMYTIKDGIDFVTIFRFSARNIGNVDTIVMISFP